MKSQFRSQNGHFRVLERFSKKSELLCGLENYRFEIVEANPNTFVIPHHCDSDAVLFVLRGESSINFIVNLAWTMHKLIVILLLNFYFFFSGKGL